MGFDILTLSILAAYILGITVALVDFPFLNTAQGLRIRTIHGEEDLTSAERPNSEQKVWAAQKLHI